jgi:hypothetical protein
MFEMRHLNHNDLFMEYGDEGDEIALWLFKKKSKRKGIVKIVRDYSGVNEEGKEQEVEINQSYYGDYRIVGNVEDYPEYLI